MTETCSARNYHDGWHEYRCRNKAKFEVDGKWYCGTHNPNKPKTKAQIAASIRRKIKAQEFRKSRKADLIATALVFEGGVKGNLIREFREVCDELEKLKEESRNE